MMMAKRLQVKTVLFGSDIMDAKRVAHKLNIEHKILYYQINLNKA